MKKLIATHNKIFHADEVTAIALLEIFTNYEIEVERVDHDTEDFSKYDFVIDIGKTSMVLNTLIITSSKVVKVQLD